MPDYDREFVLRQLHYLSRSGLPADQARDRIEKRIGPDAAAELGKVVGELSEERSPLIGRLLDFGKEKNLDQAQLSASILEMRDGLRARLMPELSRFGGLYIYVTLISIVVLMVLVLFTLFVIPQFEVLFDSFSADLPVITRWLMDPLVQGSLIAVLFLIAVFLSVVSRMAKGIFELRRDAGRWVSRLPLISSVMKRFDLWLHVLVFESLRRAGASEEVIDSELAAAVRGERRLSESGQQRVRELVARLTAAQALGTIEDELGFWDSRLESELNLALDRARSLLGFSVQIALGVIVGMLVIGLYLPIFKAGQLG